MLMRHIPSSYLQPLVGGGQCKGIRKRARRGRGAKRGCVTKPATSFSPSPGTPGEGWGGGCLVRRPPAQTPTLTLPRSTGGGDERAAAEVSRTLETPTDSDRLVT